MLRIAITAASGAYEAVIENGLIARAGEQIRQFVGEAKAFVVTVPPVRRRWGRRLMASLSAAGLQGKWIEMPDGEPAKKLVTVERLAENLVRAGADRDSVLLAFGGGVVGDVTGLLASLYMRGVRLVQIPTTVLAQVDASIGGKTAVNLRSGKNLVGTFWPPQSVLIDPAVLTTLPEREFRAGLYEALKCGVIGRPKLFDRLESLDIRSLGRDADALEWVIAESVKLKAEIVSADEREGGLRRALNLGHTIGHALEAEAGYRRFLHGEAVAWGIIAETDIARELGMCAPATAQRIVEATRRMGLLPKSAAHGRDILHRLRSDKKTRAGAIHFVLPREIGKVEVVKDIPEKVIVSAVDELREISKHKAYGTA